MISLAIGKRKLRAYMLSIRSSLVPPRVLHQESLLKVQTVVHSKPSYDHCYSPSPTLRLIPCRLKMLRIANCLPAPSPLFQLICRLPQLSLNPTNSR